MEESKRFKEVYIGIETRYLVTSQVKYDQTTGQLATLALIRGGLRDVICLLPLADQRACASKRSEMMILQKLSPIRERIDVI